MAKLYNEDKHCDLDLFYSKKTAFFDNIDFSQASPEEINKIMNLAISEIFFDDCIFTNLNLSNKKFFRKITFNKCLFKGNTDFSNSQFEDFISFDRSTFDGIIKFNDTVFNAGVSFVEIHTKPARGGYFYYRGDGIDYSKYPKYYENVLDFSGAKFETEVSFFGRRFFEDTSFSRATFYNKFWFSECNIGLKTNFNANFACDGIKNIDMCYRILKDVLSKEGYSIQARTIERLEQKIIDKQNKDDLLPSPTKPNTPNKHNSDLLTTAEAAEYLGLKINTLERWRSQFPNRLPFVKIGRTVKYRLEDLQAYISKNIK